MAILGRPSVSMNQAGMIAGQGQGFNPGNVFNPESAYAGSLHANNFNAQTNAAIAAANNKTALAGAGMQMAGSMMGASADAGGFTKIFTG